MQKLQHTGVRGMHWGIRRNRNQPGGADGIPDARDAEHSKHEKRGKLAKHLHSMKREREWSKVLNDFDHMSTKDVNNIAKRIGLENSLKTLSKDVGTKHDREEYLRRHVMDDQELSRKVTRLRAKESLVKNINTASKAQRELGERVSNVAGHLALKYVKARYAKSPLTLTEVFDTVTTKPKNSFKDAAIDDLKKIGLDKTKTYFENIDKKKKQKQQSTP